MTLRGNRRFSTDRRALLAGAGALAATAALAGCQRAEAPVDEEGRVRLSIPPDPRAWPRELSAPLTGFAPALAEAIGKR